MTTLRSVGGSQITVSRSRFIACAAPLPSEDALRAWLEAFRASHPDAKHVPYAWLGGDARGRSSDDGEPAGTGGRPCLDALRAASVVCAGVAVARIFGGQLLGRGNLARAYRDAAALALAQAEPHIAILGHPARCTVPFAALHAAEQAFSLVGLPVQREFTPTGAILGAWIPQEQVAALQRHLAQAPGARLSLRPPEWR